MKLILFVLILFFAGFTYLVVTLTNNEIADIRSRGATVGSHEAESGVVVGNASIQTDSGTATSQGASGGRYILLNASISSPTPTSGAISPTPQVGGWQLLGVHPDASVETTESARQLKTLISFNGKIYSGYGDYGANTGPVSIKSFDPTTKVFTQEWIADTEAIANFRIIRNKVYAPSTDRRASADYAVGTPWKDVTGLSTTHAYDVVTLNGSDLWLVGSQGTSACTWRSLDDGATWTRSLCVPPQSGGTNLVARFHFAGVYQGKLYVQAKDLNGYAHSTSKIFDGTTWSDGPSLLSVGGEGWRPIEFAGKLVYRMNEGSGTVAFFDGTSWFFPKGPTGKASIFGTDIVQDGNDLYFLSSTEIFKTTNLTSWTIAASTVPTGARSLAVLNGKLYVGTADSKIYVYQP